MSVIRDSRTLYGPQPHASAADVEAHWDAYAHAHGWWDPATGVRTPGQKVKKSLRVLDAYVDDGRWVADCPCGGGIGCWPEMDRGCCYDCGTAYLIRFPAPSEIAAAERVLTERPEAAQRGWRPDRGETIQDLKVENLTRGYRMGGN